MKMTQYNHFICHFYCHFSAFSHILLSAGHDVPEEVWRPLLIFFSKIISCCLHRSVPDLIHHQYGISRMYSKENPKDFRLPVPCLYPWEWVMLLLSTEAAFKPGGPFLGEFTSENLSQGFIPGRPSLAYKGCGYSIFCTELSVGIIGIYGTGSHASYPPSRARGFPHQCCLHLPL